jgi:hypothetical protein
MGHRNDNYLIVVMPEYNLKRKFSYAACPVPSIDSSKPFGIALDVRNRYVDGNTETARGFSVAFRVPTCGRFQLGRCIGMKTNSHRLHRAP